MRSKKFRNQTFCIGDLVVPNWTPKEPLGMGIIVGIEQKIDNRRESFFGPYLTVCWQLGGLSNEAESDLTLAEPALD